MLRTSKSLMKRMYFDGQYMIERKSDWLLQVTIEGPFGQRASNSLILWLGSFPAFYQKPQYVLIEASNIGPVVPQLFDGLIEIVRQHKIGGLAVVRSELSEKNLEALATRLDSGENIRVGLFDNTVAALQFQERLYGTTTQPADFLSPSPGT